MHKTFVTLAPYLGEGRDSGALVPWFYFGPVVHKESFKGFILILALVTVFSVSSKLKQNTY